MEDYYAPDMSRLNGLLIVLLVLFALSLAGYGWMWSQLGW